MKNKIIITLLLCFAFQATLFAQAPVRHASPEVRQRARDRSDYALFRRQMSTLKEFAEERKKIPALQKENKREIVKVGTAVDSVETDDTAKSKFITGYITQQIGDNSANAYEITFDRTLRKIINVKRTGESTEPEQAEVKEKKTTAKDGAVKKAAPKKKRTGDDEEEEEEKEEKEEKEPKEKDE